MSGEYFCKTIFKKKTLKEKSGTEKYKYFVFDFLKFFIKLIGSFKCSITPINETTSISFLFKSSWSHSSILKFISLFFFKNLFPNWHRDLLGSIPTDSIFRNSKAFKK